MSNNKISAHKNNNNNRHWQTHKRTLIHFIHQTKRKAQKSTRHNRIATSNVRFAVVMSIHNRTKFDPTALRKMYRSALFFWGLCFASAVLCITSKTTTKKGKTITNFKSQTDPVAYIFSALESLDRPLSTQRNHDDPF